MNSNIVVERNELIDILKKNKEEHIKIYTESIEGFKQDAKKQLEEKINDLAAGKIDCLSVHLTKPQTHEKEYNTAIKMLELHTNATIELNQQDFSNLVLDEWQWQQGWLVYNSQFSPLASGMGVSKGYLSA